MPSDTNEFVWRTVEIDARSVDYDARTVDAVLSTSGDVVMGFGVVQRLMHDEGSINFERAASGLPLLWNHNQDNLIGAVKNIRTDGSKLRGTLKFSTSAAGEEKLSDVRDGILKDISIGYRIDPKGVEVTPEGVEIVRGWTPAEVSIVAVPADPNAGINRSIEGKLMEDKKPDLKVVENARLEGAKAEQARQAEIRAAFELAGIDKTEVLSRCLNDVTVTADAARKLVLEEIGKGNAGNVSRGAYVQVGDEQNEKTQRAMNQAVLSRAGFPLNEDERRELQGNEYAHMTLREIARECLAAAGINHRGLSARDLVGKALTCRSTFGLSTSDFDNILENSASKFLLQGFDEANTTWRKITRTMPINDFKVTSLPTLGAFPDLSVVPAGAEFKYGTVSDRKETIQLLTYGRLFSLTRQAIINDDLGAFTEIPRKMGQAADRTINAQVYAVLTGNPAMVQDGDTLFHANHANIGSTAAITVASVDAARVLMRKQTDSTDANADGLNNDIAMLIVPSELEGTANALRRATDDPVGATGAIGGATRPNTEMERWDVVSDVLLSQTSGTVWYASANPNSTDTLIAGFLDGQTTPFLESENGFTVDGTSWKVRIDVAAIPADFRGLVRSV